MHMLDLRAAEGIREWARRFPLSTMQRSTTSVTPSDLGEEMSVKVGTFNLNNLFGRWNLYVDVAEDGTTELASAPPRPWLADAPPAAPESGTAASGTSKPKVPGVPDHDRWDTHA